MAPATLGTFQGAFTFGHLRQLDRLTGQTLKRAWAAGARPGDGPMTIDLDSTICQVHDHPKQGPASGSTHTSATTRWLPPVPLAVRCCTPASTPGRPTPPPHHQLRRGAGRPGAPRRRSRGTDPGRRFGVLVGHDDPGLPPPPAPPSPSPSARPRRPEPRFRRSTRTPGSTSSTPTGPGAARQDPLPGERLIMRRTRLVGAQAELSPPDATTPLSPAGHHGRAGPTAPPPRSHRAGHPRPQRRGRPAASSSGKFAANTRLAGDRHPTHNLPRWITQIGLGARRELVVAKTLRRTLLAPPGRITRPASRLGLHLPADWPRAAWSDPALARLRGVAYAT
jgi:hypothetical protein